MPNMNKLIHRSMQKEDKKPHVATGSDATNVVDPNKGKASWLWFVVNEWTCPTGFDEDARPFC